MSEAPARIDVTLSASAVGAEDVPAGYKRTNLGLVPEDWDSRPLRDDVSLLSGHHVLARHCNNQGIGTPYLTGPADFPNGRINHTSHTVQPTTLCSAGDILVTVKGSGAGMLIQVDSEYCISRQLMAIRPVSWNRGFLYYSLLQNASRFRAASTGLIPGLSRADILDEHLPIPRHLEEQRAIAKALSDVDSLLESLDALIAKKRAIKQAAMQQLLVGKTRLPGFNGQWQQKKIGLLANVVRGASPRPIDSPIWFDTQSNIGWLRISDVTASGKFLYDTSQSLSPAGVANSRLVTSGSLVMSICATVGRPIILKKDVCIHDGFIVFDNLRSDKEFLYYFLSSIEERWSKHGQTGSQMNLNTDLINSTPVLVPPPTEQRDIAAVLSDMDADIAGLESRREKAYAIKQGMMQQLLTGRVRLV